MRPFSRREFLVTAATAAGAFAFAEDAPEPVIDIHQHTDYAGRTDEQLIAHQRTMGVTHTILLPAGRFFVQQGRVKVPEVLIGEFQRPVR